MTDSRLGLHYFILDLSVAMIELNELVQRLLELCGSDGSIAIIQFVEGGPPVKAMYSIGLASVLQCERPYLHIWSWFASKQLNVRIIARKELNALCAEIVSKEGELVYSWGIGL